jgi:SOS-response transcriptional repressor LexA
MNSIGPVIAKYRKQKHLTQPELVALLHKEGIDITDKALSSWEINRTEPSARQFLILCKVLGIQDIYEEMFGVNPYNPLRLLNEEGKERAGEYVNMLATNERFAEEGFENTQKTAERHIPYYYLGVSAGTGNFLDSEGHEEIAVDEFVPAAADFAVHISGDSMMPMFRDGQIIYVHSQDTVEDGEIGIFALDGNAYCKRLQRNKKGTALISLNKKYEPIPILETSSLTVFGKVII